MFEGLVIVQGELNAEQIEIKRKIILESILDLLISLCVNILYVQMY